NADHVIAVLSDFRLAVGYPQVVNQHGLRLRRVTFSAVTVPPGEQIKITHGVVRTGKRFPVGYFSYPLSVLPCNDACTVHGILVSRNVVDFEVDLVGLPDSEVNILRWLAQQLPPGTGGKLG